MHPSSSFRPTPSYPTPGTSDSYPHTASLPRVKAGHSSANKDRAHSDRDSRSPVPAMPRSMSIPARPSPYTQSSATPTAAHLPPAETIAPFHLHLPCLQYRESPAGPRPHPSSPATHPSADPSHPASKNPSPPQRT